jgi:FkbH-like protein
MNHTNQVALDARHAFSAALSGREVPRAIQAARTLLKETLGTRHLTFIRKSIEKVDGLDLIPFKVALMASFSIEFLHDPLIVQGFLNGLKIDVYTGGFAQFSQEILDPQSGLYRFGPNAIVLAIEGRDWLPAIYRSYLDNPEAGRQSVRRAQDEIASLVEELRSRSQAALLVHNLFPPVWAQLGILDSQTEHGQAQSIRDFNDELVRIARRNSEVYIVDYAGLVSRIGAVHWYDERMYYYARAPIAQPMLWPLASEYLKYFRGLTGRTKKCLVLDLDNTLWGGVLGEEGIWGIALGPNYPGSAYVAFQEEILALQRKGVILAVASKNNAPEVDHVFASHPHMVLTKDHFTRFEVHWRPKSQSLQEISRQLNIALEHMVFVDDSPVECAEVVNALPVVTAIPLPRLPEQFVGALREEGLFDGLSFSSEDRRRRELYGLKSQADELLSRSDSLEEFYRSLLMEITFAPLQRATLARAAQLTQKTNQFNVTTVRYSEADLSVRLADSRHLMTTVQVRDRFGDNGIVGLMLALVRSEALEIDTFLLSCRLIGRTVETAMLTWLHEHARARGIRKILGRVIPTAKNQPCRDLFHKHGFQKQNELERGETEWLLDLSQVSLAYPSWFNVVDEAVPSLEVAEQGWTESDGRADQASDGGRSGSGR